MYISSQLICRYCGGSVIYDPRTGYGVCSECGSLTEDLMIYQYSYQDMIHSSPISKSSARQRTARERDSYEEFIDDIARAIKNLCMELSIPPGEVWMLASKYTMLWSGRMSRTIAELFVLAHCLINGNIRCIEAMRIAYPQRFNRLMKLASYVARKEGYEVEARGSRDTAARGAKSI